MPKWGAWVGDAERLPFDDDAFDLVFGSPPYMDCRKPFVRRCDEWIEWMIDVTTEAVRVSRGLVMWVVSGSVRNGEYQPGPEGLLYRWWRHGGVCWRPAIWHKNGIPGSGGKKWLRCDHEYVLVFVKHGAAPYGNPIANGSEPKYRVGGAMTARTRSGNRSVGKDKDGQVKYKHPSVVNPGSVVRFTVGGGHLGHKLAHMNEAPYPLDLARWFVRGWCPPGGSVFDPFCGSGTTLHAAWIENRDAFGVDIREGQVEITKKRMQGLTGECGVDSIPSKRR